jgi:hypothetical protein
MNTKLLSTDRPIALYYVFLSDVSSITVIGGSHCYISMTGEWKGINITIGSIEYNEEPKQNAGGTYYEYNLTASVPGHDATTPEKNLALNGRKVLIRADYRNGLKRIIGDMEYAPKLFITIDSKTTTFRKLKSEFKSKYPSKWLSDTGSGGGEGV